MLSFPAVRFFIFLKNNSVIKFQIFDIFLFFRIFSAYFWKIYPLNLTWSIWNFLSRCYMLQYYVFEKYFKICPANRLFWLFKYRKNSKKSLFFRKNRFSEPKLRPIPSKVSNFYFFHSTYQCFTLVSRITSF